MAAPVRVGRLYFHFEDYEREPDYAAGGDLLTLEVTLENNGRPVGEVGRAPGVELRDGAGAVYEPVNLDEAWTMPHEPSTSATAQLRFRVPEEAVGLEVVLAPGTEEEVRVDLEQTLDYR